MAIDLEALQDSLQAILEPVVTGIDSQAILIIEPNNFTTPNTSYATMNLVTFDKKGFTDIRETDSNGDTLVRAEYDITFSFRSFGDKSKSINSNLNFALTDNILINESLVKIGLSQFNAPVMTDVPVFENTKWEERNQITVQFHYAYEELIQTSLIAQTTLDGTYRDATGNIVIQTSQTIISP